MDNLTWRYEKRNVKDLLLNERNPRFIKNNQAAGLKSSLTKFGLCQPIVINLDGKVIGGHQRLRSLSKFGSNLVDVAVPSRLLTDKEVEELSIRLNKNIGEWDYDILANEYDNLELLTWGFDLKDFEIEEEKNDKPKKYQITINFDNEEELITAEVDVSAILDKYSSASYKVKIK